MTPKQVAAEWQLSLDTIQRLFINEPDVLKFEAPMERGRKRKPKATLRIPIHVKERVRMRHTNKRK